MLLFIALEAFTHYMPRLGQSPDVLRLAVPYYHLLNWSLVPLLLFFTFKQFAEGVESTKPAMVITLFVNVLNIFLNYLLIFGHWGFEAMGLVGAGYATLIARVLQAVLMIAYVLSVRYFRPFVHELFRWRFGKAFFWHILQISIPIGLQYIIEVGAFAAGAIMIGWLGEAPLAAHQIAIGLAALTFLMASGIATAVTIRTSNLLGAGQVRQVRIATTAGLHLGIAFMTFTALGFLLGYQWLPSLHTTDATVIEIASGLMLIAAVFQIFDGIQVTNLSALRGIADVRIPTLLALLAHWGVSLPIGYLLAFHFGFEEKGIWMGFLSGLLTMALLTLNRFFRITGRWKRNPDTLPGDLTEEA
jgi:MATE family multidrug resistance protein